MRVLITPEQIQSRIDAVAREISETYKGESITIVGVLTGCIVFVADLIRRLDLPIKIALVQASSYRGKATTAGALHVQDDLLPELKGRHVLLIDDILDTGATLAHMVAHLRAQGVASVRTAVLLHKKERQQVAIEPDFVGFDIPNEFVVGYGLDYDDEYRNLPYIGILDAPEAS